MKALINVFMSNYSCTGETRVLSLWNWRDNHYISPFFSVGGEKENQTTGNILRKV